MDASTPHGAAQPLREDVVIAAAPLVLMVCRLVLVGLSGRNLLRALVTPPGHRRELFVWRGVVLLVTAVITF
jgi:hypothetical protein